MKLASLAGIASTAIVAAIAATSSAAWAYQDPENGSVRLSFKVPPTINMTLTPNYQSGYGPIGGTGSGYTPAVGSGASLQGGFVDFGSVYAGYAYLYKYAARVSVTTNDAQGFTLYAEGTADFDTSVPIATSLTWMVSSSNNTAFTGPPTAHAFEKTTATVTGSGATTGISYTGAPPTTAQVWSFVPTTQQIGQPMTQAYDYGLNVPSSANTSTYSVYVVYTSVAT